MNTSIFLAENVNIQEYNKLIRKVLEKKKLRKGRLEVILAGGSDHS